MLGLGVLIKVGKQYLGGLSALLKTLVSRATYSENKTDSDAVVEALDTAGILDDATILLTPTAYSNARVHSVKKYTGDEYITNGDFSSTDISIIGGAGTRSVVNGQLKIEEDGLGFSQVQYNGLLNSSKTYKATFDITLGTGSYNIYDTTQGLVQITSSGTYTFYLSGTTRLYVGSNGVGDIWYMDNISVVDVSSDFDFDRASSATRINSDGLVQDMQSITDPELVLNGDFEELGDDIVTDGDFPTPNINWSLTNATIETDGARINNTVITGFSGISQLLSGTLSNKQFILTYDVVATNGQNLVLDNGTSLTLNTSTTGVGKELYFEWTRGDNYLVIKREVPDTDVTIDNVSVQQVDPNDRWTVVDSDANNYVEFTEGFARLKFSNTSPITKLETSTQILQANQTYELVVDVHDVTSGEIKIDGVGIQEYFTTEGVTTRYITPTGDTPLRFYRNSANVDITLASVSVKDITFSTDVDLARINYDSNGQNGHILLEPTSTNLITYSEDFSEWNKGNNTTVTPNFAISPDGTQNATRFQTPTVSGSYLTLAASMTIGNDYTLTLFLKNNGGENIDIGVAASSTVGTKTASVEVNLTNEWVRYELNFTADSNSNFVFIDNINNTNSVDCLIWGAQLEELSYATSYIPNHGTALGVTRAAETLTGSGNSTLIDTTQGTIYLESKLGGTTGTKLVSIGGGTNNADPAITIGYTGQNMYMDIVDSGSLIATPSDRTITGINTSSYNKMAIKYTTTNVTVYLNGVKKHTETIDFTPATNVLKALYAGYGTGSKFEGEIKVLAVFDRALNDTELGNLTNNS